MLRLITQASCLAARTTAAIFSGRPTDRKPLVSCGAATHPEKEYWFGEAGIAVSAWPKSASHAGLIQPTQLLDMGCSEVEGRVLKVRGFASGLFCDAGMLCFFGSRLRGLLHGCPYALASATRN